MRRANGEGSVVQRSDGRWQASVAIKGKRLTAYGKTRKEAFEKLQAKRATVVDNPPNSVPTVPTLHDYIDQWAARSSRSRGAGAWRAATEESAKTSAEKLKKLPSAALPLDKVDPYQIRDEMQGWSQSVAYTADKWLRAIYNDAVIRDVIDKSPLKKITAVKHERNNDKVFALSMEEAERLIKSSPERLSHWLTIAFNTGLRPGELRGLNIKDLNGTKLTIQRQRNKFGAVTSKLKTKAAERVISVHDNVINAMKELAKEDKYGWLVKDGEGYSQFCSNLKKACLVAEVPVITWHGCRHSHSTWLLTSGISPHLVSKRLGHSDIVITLRIYAHCFTHDEEALLKVTV